ncbi:MAG: DUF2142 domain-containing protein [Anaerolineae bacterium]
MKRLTEHRALAALVIVFLALGTLYSLATPIFEAGDEVWHYPFVQWLATGHGLPVQDPAHKALWEQEGGQPPLYYALAAAATFWVDTSDMPDRLWRNPFEHSIGVPLAYGNKNLVVHTPAEKFPWHNTTLAVHLLRFLSLLFGVGTVVLTYLLAREIISRTALHGQSAGEWLALGAAGLVAFNPMFLFISASVNNDNLATLLASAALLLVVQLATRGASTRRLMALGIVIGLGALTKVSDAALAPLAALIVLWLAWRRRDLGLLIRAGLLLAIPTLVIAGWWYLRNAQLYGDPLAFNVWMQIAGPRPPTTLLQLLDEFQGFRISFWGNFGGVNLIAPDWVYLALDLISLLALAGLVAGALRRRMPGVLIIPALWLAFIFVSLIRWTLMTYASQGRLIFPAISAVAVLMALGLSSLVLEGWKWAGARPSNFPTGLSNFQPVHLLVLLLTAFAVTAPFFIIMPAYALPMRIGGDADAPNPVHISFVARDGEPELVGYELGRAARPGEELPVTLYWRTMKPVSDDLYVYIHLYDRSGKPVGQWEALPGNGLYPVQFWQPGELIVDRYRVPVGIEAQGPQVGRVEVGLARVGSVVPLKAHDPEGQEVTPSIGRFKIVAVHLTASDKPVLDKFGDVFDLVQFTATGKRGITEFEVTPPRPRAIVTPLRAGDTLHVDFALRALRVPPDDYTIFVHLVDSQGHIVAQQDNQPQGNTFPTSFWDPGEEVSDRFEMAIPASTAPGDYRIEFGLYGSNGKRLPVSGSPGSGGLQAQGDYLFLAPLKLE